MFGLSYLFYPWGFVVQIIADDDRTLDGKASLLRDFDVGPNTGADNQKVARFGAAVA